MKKYICFAAALAIVGAASCNKELVDNNAPEVPEVKIATLTATIGEPDTKTTLAAPEGAHTNGSVIHWAAEDALSVFDGASNVKYTIKTEEDVDYTPAPTAVFEGTELAEAEGYYALYPYTESATLADGVIKGAVLPAIQTAVTGNIPAGAALAVAYTEDRETINFKNVATIIGFTLTEAADKVEFVAKGGEAIAGTIDVTINDGLTTYTVQEETGSNKVTLNNLEAGTYYFTILPDVTLTQGYEFYIGEELAKSNDSELHLVRSKVYSLGEVKVPLKDRELSFSPASYEITWGDDFTEPTLNGLTNTDQVTYSIESGDAATITPEGVVTLVKAGTVIIKATVAATDTHNEGSATYTLTINRADRNLAFSSYEYDAVWGKSFTAPTLSGNKDGVTYTTSSSSVAVVDQLTGVVTLKGKGDVTITATAEQTDTYNAQSISYTINVKPIYVYILVKDLGWNAVNANGLKLTQKKTVGAYEYYVAELESKTYNELIFNSGGTSNSFWMVEWTNIDLTEDKYIRLCPKGVVEIDPNDETTFGYSIYVFDQKSKNTAPNLYAWDDNNAFKNKYHADFATWPGVSFKSDCYYKPADKQSWRHYYYYDIPVELYGKSFKFIVNKKGQTSDIVVGTTTTNADDKGDTCKLPWHNVT